MFKFTERDVSQVHSSLSPRNWKPFQITEEDVAEDFAALRAIGIGFDQSYLTEMLEIARMASAMDSNDVGILPTPTSMQTSPSVPGLVQFLQAWLPGYVNFFTAARKIDTLVGMDTIGSWEDEQIVQGMLEPTGNAVPYGDLSNIPLTSWNVNYEWRNVVRFEMGFIVGRLEELRASRIRVSSQGEKRNQAGLALEIQRNRVGFYGYNDGAGRTYGFLNDPGLPAYVTFPNGATSGSPSWNTKTFNDITADIRLGLYTLEVQGMGNIDVETAPITMALPVGKRQFLTVTQSVGGISVRQWIRDNYPNLRIETAPELQDANGGSSAVYFYIENFADGSSDGGKVWQQVVPAKFLALGVERRAKAVVEDAANATAGIMCKRPFGVARFSGA